MGVRIPNPVIIAPPGPEGPEGPSGAPGVDGADGEGVPAGGTAGQVLSKVDGVDYNTEWTDAASGGGDTGTVIDGGSADSTYGGTVAIDGGTAA